MLRVALSLLLAIGALLMTGEGSRPVPTPGECVFIATLVMLCVCLVQRRSVCVFALESCACTHPACSTLSPHRPPPRA